MQKFYPARVGVLLRLILVITLFAMESPVTVIDDPSVSLESDLPLLLSGSASLAVFPVKGRMPGPGKAM